MPNEQDHFNILRKINKSGKLTQRQLADKLGFSLGKLNYCIKALKKKGLIKISNFKKSSDKLNKFIYVLTPRGISHRTKLTINFMKLKMKEYDELKRELNNKHQIKWGCYKTTIMDLFNKLDVYSQNISIIDENLKSFSYKELLFLADKLGKNIRKRETVFLICKNSYEFVVAYVGLIRAKGVIFLINNSIVKEKLHYLISHYKPN